MWKLIKILCVFLILLAKASQFQATYFVLQNGLRAMVFSVQMLRCACVHCFSLFEFVCGAARARVCANGSGGAKGRAFWLKGALTYGMWIAPELVAEAQQHHCAQEIAVAHERVGGELVARVRLRSERLHDELARAQLPSAVAVVNVVRAAISTRSSSATCCSFNRGDSEIELVKS